MFQKRSDRLLKTIIEPTKRQTDKINKHLAIDKERQAIEASQYTRQGQGKRQDRTGHRKHKTEARQRQKQDKTKARHNKNTKDKHKPKKR
jgi:hypothetical protein